MGLLSFFKREKVKTLNHQDLGWTNLNSGPFVPQNDNFKDSLQESTVFSCIMYLSQDVSKVPLKIYKQGKKEGERELALNHPTYEIFRYGPNDYQTIVDFLEYKMWSFLRKGNCYSFIERDDNFNVIGLYPINPDRVEVYEGYDGSIFYGVSPGSGHDQFIWEKFSNYMDDGKNHYLIPARFIWHLKDVPTGNGTKGLSRLSAQAPLIKQSLKQREFANSQIDNRSAPAVVLVTDKKLNEDATKRLKAGWDDKFLGASKAFKTAVLQDGFKPEVLKVDYGDLQIVEKYKLTDMDIARIFRVPMSKLMTREGSSYNNQETENQAYVNDSLMPFFEKFEKSIDKFLLNPKENLFSEFDVSRLMRGDSKSRAELYRTTRQWGITTPNECRIMEGLNPDENGDTLHIPMNMGELGKKDDGGEQ